MILNLTQHASTDAQREAGVVDLPDDERAQLSALITFDEAPDRAEIEARADAVAALAAHNGLGGDEGDDPYPPAAMIGGAPFFMAALEAALLDRHIEPVYAFSRRESVDVPQEDGSVRKQQVFRHVGFVRPYEGQFR